MEQVHDAERLKELQALPLDRKIQISQARIIEWYQRWNGNVYVSFSGGKDSTVLLDIVRKIYPDVPAVFLDTGLEYPELREFVKTFSNVVWLKPEMNFRKVIETYGYPLISKEVAKRFSEYNNAKRKGKLEKSLAYQEFNGIRKAPHGKSFYNKQKWRFLVDAPFKISHKCCDIMKKKPAKKYEKQTERKPIIATMACESKARKTAWLKHGCNAFDGARQTSQPMSFWTEQDVLRYLIEYGDEIIQMRRDFFVQNLHSGEHTIATLQNGVEVIDISDILERDYSSPIASVYGDIVAADDDGNEYAPNPMMCAGCKLKTTGADRTGCLYCCFGCHLEKGETRFQRLARTHPRQYEYALGGGQWVDNPAYDPTAPEYDGAWKNWNPKKIWVPSKKGIGLKAVFDMVNEIYGKDFYRYE